LLFEKYYTFARINFKPLQDNEMKKVLTTLMIAGVFAITSCGPSAEEKAAMDKARQDSIDKVQKEMNDSIEMANKAAMEKAQADSAAAADMEKARMDSMEAAGKKKK
jgi:hypothetical protein